MECMNEHPTPAVAATLASLDHSRVWRDGVLVDQDVNADNLVALLKDPTCLVWIDLLDPSPEALGVVVEHLHLPPTAVEDALAPRERAKMIRHDSHLFFTVYETRLESASRDRPERLGFSRVSGIVLPMALVTIRLEESLDIDDLTARWQQDPGLLKVGSAGLVYGLFDYVVDSHFDTIQLIDDQLERLEDVLFEQKATNRLFQRDVFSLRKDLVQLRRVVLPMREVVSGVLHTPDRGPLDPWYDDLYDHVLRASEWTESLRDLVTSIFETNLSLQEARLNTIMRKLAAWAAIIAVPTLITSWYGQNIPYPGFNETSGLVASLLLIVVSAATLFWAFRKWDWL